MKIINSLSFLILILSFLLIYSLKSLSHAMSFLVGAMFMLFNIWSISKTWGLVLKKKSIALAGLIIVLKYPLLFFVLKLILEKNWISPTFFIFGLVAFSFVGLLIRKVDIVDKEKKH